MIVIVILSMLVNLEGTLALYDTYVTNASSGAFVGIATLTREVSLFLSLYRLCCSFGRPPSMWPTTSVNLYI